MARSPIEIALASETKAFKQGIDAGVIKPLEDAIKTLRDLGDADGADKLEASLKDAQRATEKLGDETKITAARIEREYRDAYRTARQSSNDATSKMTDGAKEVQQEFGQNMGEAVSSFRGNLEDIGQIGQDTLGGLAGTVSQLGPAGVVAGAGLGVAAAAVGTIVDVFNKAKEASDEAKESAYEYGLTVASAGQYADTAARINELTGSIEKLKEVQDIATATGREQKDVLKALATGEGIPALNDALNDSVGKTDIATSRLLELQGVLEGTQQGFALSKDGASLQASALYDLATAAGNASDEVDDLGNKVVTMPDGKKIVIDAQTKTAYEDIDALERRQISDKTVRLRLDSSEWDNWRPGAKVGNVRVAVGQGGGGGITWE